MGRLVPNFGKGGSVGVSFVLLCLSSVRKWYTFTLPDKANTPARNFGIWQKYWAGPLPNGQSSRVHPNRWGSRMHPNRRGSRVYPNGWGSRARPGWGRRCAGALPSQLALRAAPPSTHLRLILREQK